MTLKLSELLQIHRFLPRPRHCGSEAIAQIRKEPSGTVSIQEIPDPPWDDIEEITFRAEWGQDPETHSTKLVWHLLGKHDIIFDRDLTRSPLVLP